MAQNTAPTLEDVALRTGVSTATISRCLNSPDRVSEKTRVRILEAVKELGYTPNFNAKALAAKRTNTVGAVIPTMSNAIFALGLQAFQETLTENGITLLVASSSFEREAEATQIRALVAKGADALLLIGDERDQETYDFLQSREIPYVISWNYRAHKNHTFVGFNNRKAAYLIAKQVLNLGHKKIGMISGVLSNNDRAFDRVQGVKDAMAEFSMIDSDFICQEASYNFDDAGHALDTILESNIKPTAIICGNDVLAIGAITRAKALGLNIPDDISITGFDDIEISSIFTPPITTVSVPHTTMGRKAAETLLEMMHSDDRNLSLELETSIINRGSLSAPRNGR